ncbi:MAG: hypothetical protein DI629_20670 [Mesorhizobium amorphae]|nr:MAG: hypothetical protein DI629_20670 [Mesorhizobium amorphae]
MSEIDLSLGRAHAALKAFRIPVTTEAEAQRGVEAALARGGIGFEPQVILGPGERPDALTDDGVAIEIKVKGTRPAIMRQLTRYAAHDRVRALLLVSAVPWPWAAGEIGGKQFRLLRLSEGWL